MQLHPGSYALSWHTSDNSDLSMQWGHLSRPYSSTDRSSSLGSVESLDTPTPTTQPYSDSHNSPVDPTLFNNKRDSAYSSFSASSNTSDYATVPLRPGEACSMENLLQSLGPACPEYPTVRESSGEAMEEAQLIAQKTRSLTRSRPRDVEVKERPSSCCFEQELRGLDFIRNGDAEMEIQMNPPQPPTRKDSFKATRGRPHSAINRCTSAPIENSRVYCPYEENKSSCMTGISGVHNGSTAEDNRGSGPLNHDSFDSHCVENQTNLIKQIRNVDKDYNSDHLSDPVTTYIVSNPSPGSGSLTSKSSVEVEGQSFIRHSKTKHTSTGLHRHSAPEKLLATQLQLLQLNCNGSSLEPFNLSHPSDTSSSQSSSQWSQPLVEPTPEISPNASLNKWEGNRSSTPGSVFLQGDGEDSSPCERPDGICHNGESLLPAEHHVTWGRSVSVPGEPTGTSTKEDLSCDHVLQNNFVPLSAAASVDSLLEEQRAMERERSGGKNEENAERETKKQNSSRNHRRNRRRSERFATNLRNEIQRKKAQLQRSRGPGGLLGSGEIVQEEEDLDTNEDEQAPDLALQERGTKVTFASPAVIKDSSSVAPFQTSNSSNEPNYEGFQSITCSRSVQILDPGVPSFGVGIRVVEEPAPAGKARRWRWTPEHKLQPEQEQNRLRAIPNERVLGLTGSRHGVCAMTSSSSSYGRSSSVSRKEETDLLPFADRMKFFEETSKGVCNLSYRSKKPSHNPKHHEGEFSQPSTQRRYSYQGGILQESGPLPNSIEARRQSMSTSRERQKEKERESREREERASEREREERLRETERRLEKERREKELEMEKTRRKEIQWQMEREERLRQWEREREREIQLEREKEMERTKEMERLRMEREQFEMEREEDSHFNFCHFNGISSLKERNKDFQHKENLYCSSPPRPRASSHSLNHNQGPPSAFYPVSTSAQLDLHQGYTTRSYTPTEPYSSAGQQETTKLNRKYSLTERDYVSWRWESPLEGSTQHPPPQEGRWGRDDHSRFSSAPLSLRGRAMSENDLCFDSSHRWSPSVSMTTSQTLSEVEEGDAPGSAEKSKKKTPPPPRPPPPNWEQFHRRRASHHTLFTSCAPQPLPPVPPFVPSPDSSSRQRSYSLPPERPEASDGCPRCTCNQSSRDAAFNHASSNQNQPMESFTVAPPSPMFSRRAFRPVAPPPRHPESDFPFLPPPPPPVENNVNSLPHGPTLRPAAQWDGAPPPRGGVCCVFTPPFSHSDEPPQTLEPGTESEATLSPSPAHSLDAELNVPMETDIDDFQEEELPAGEAAISSELPCFALPVTVLETDIDSLPEPEGEGAAESGSVEKELEENRSQVLSLEEELFPQSGEGESGTESWGGAPETLENNTDSLDRRSVSSSCSSYYSTSTAKAQILSQMKDVTDNTEHGERDELSYKKQLMESLRKKLSVLREAQRGLQEDIRANCMLGEEIENMVVSVCKPNEVDKFRMFIGDLDKVVSLLLSLSGRLLRVETSLENLDSEADLQERRPLQEKKRQLMRQLSEAQDLKEHVDRREQAVSRVLGSCLTTDQHRDYSHFVKMKAALLVEQKQLEDKIRLGEEQLRGLRESLGLGLGLGVGMLMGYGHY
ncbi:protein Shroom4 isoform X2 [Gouania willdenowi]|uniref:ASD2 domain-containing protein n=2 Tax=Gouania willdenowi TaxID=441366 RepID=A0A8C5EWJ0_GOUWI|nr:protein Shroom4 isoform X2 [Gouania willdenowi]